jgi:hypothetical protein
MGKRQPDSVYRSASFAAWQVSNRASDARRYATEADRVRDQLVASHVTAEVLAAADAVIARVREAAEDAMAVWEESRALLEKSIPDSIEQVGEMFVLRGPHPIPIGAPTASDIRYNDASQAMRRGRAALDELIALAHPTLFPSQEPCDPEVQSPPERPAGPSKRR